MKLDPWQEKVMKTKGNMVLRSGRQVGKSTIIAKKAADYALNNPKKIIMCIAFTEKQAGLIFAKILHNIVQTDKTRISKPKPTKHIIKLKNGSEIYCYAAGDTGFGIMGFTIDLLIADEAAWIKEEVWNSIVPALAVTHGTMWLLSTPWMNEGFYYDCFDDKAFTAFHQSSEDCPRISEEFLERMRKRFTKSQYSQMYLGNFVADFKRVFTDDWIESTCTLPPTNSSPSGGDLYLGVDIAGMGDDESTFEGIRRIGDKLIQFHHEVTTKTRTTDTIAKILELNRRYDFQKIGIDDGGMGIGILDQLLETDETKRKTVGLNNAKRAIDSEDNTKKLLKEDMYNNLVAMGERNEIKLFDDTDVKDSLRSITIEDNGRIGGRYSHIVEGIIRSAYLGKGKEINTTIYTIKV